MMASFVLSCKMSAKAQPPKTKWTWNSGVNCWNAEVGPGSSSGLTVLSNWTMNSSWLSGALNPTWGQTTVLHPNLCPILLCNHATVKKVLRAFKPWKYVSNLKMRRKALSGLASRPENGRFKFNPRRKITRVNNYRPAVSDHYTKSSWLRNYRLAAKITVALLLVHLFLLRYVTSEDVGSVPT